MNYADWIIRLNYVLNPGKTLPEQRIKLDTALRQAQLIPVEVTFGDTNCAPQAQRAGAALVETSSLISIRFTPSMIFR